MDSDLPSRFLAQARRHLSPNAYRSRLLPFREAILVYRGKRTSYERIAWYLKSFGIDVQPSTVGYFCRKMCPPSEVQRALRESEAGIGETKEPPKLPTSADSRPPAAAPAKRRSGRIARDDL
jgi:hypothetical protein